MCIGVENALSIVLALCTVAYTIINGLMLHESKKQRKLKSMPNIILYLKSTEDSHGLRLYIKNVGEGVAMNIKGFILKDYNRFGQEIHKLSETGLFKYGLYILPPGEHCKYYLDTWSNINQSDIENLYIEIEINYEGVDRKKHIRAFKLHFSQVFGQGYTNPPETHVGKIAYYLEKVSKSLSANPHPLSNGN